jgi:hypothetical protein
VSDDATGWKALNREFAAAVSEDLARLSPPLNKRALARLLRSRLGVRLSSGSEKDFVDNWLSGQLPLSSKGALGRPEILQAVQDTMDDLYGAARAEGRDSGTPHRYVQRFSRPHVGKELAPRTGGKAGSDPGTGAFWAAMGSRGPTIVVGIQDRAATESWERSGLIGLGCVRALVHVQRQLWSNGFECQFVGVEDLPPVRWDEDLILLGGPDVNLLTAEFMTRLGPRSSFTFPHWRRHEVSIFDKRRSTYISPRLESDSLVDYGLIIRSPNPLAFGDSEVLILAGCWGFGTAAAAMALASRSFRENPVCASGAPFEALIRTTVVGGAPHSVVVVEARPLDPPISDSAASSA